MCIRDSCLLALLALPAHGAPPQLAFPPGTTETFAQVADPGDYALPVSRATPGDAPVKRLEGRVLRRALRIPAARGDTLALVQALRAQLTEAGFEILFDCAGKVCGGFDFRFATEVLPPPEMEFSLADFRQLSAWDPQTGRHASLLISRTPRGAFVQTTFVEDGKPPLDSLEPVASGQTSQPALDATLAERLDRDGRAVLETVIFASGSTDLDAETRASLAGLALLLTDRPGLSLTIVGHTDTEGSLDSNIAVSRARARAVAQALTQDHGIDPARLDAQGAGYLAPRTSNATEKGRAMNRRVEVVAR